ncbi:unnamed protein product [Rhizopus microsporus]
MAKGRVKKRRRDSVSKRITQNSRIGQNRKYRKYRKYRKNRKNRKNRKYRKNRKNRKNRKYRKYRKYRKNRKNRKYRKYLFILVINLTHKGFSSISISFILFDYSLPAQHQLWVVSCASSHRSPQ